MLVFLFAVPFQNPMKRAIYFAKHGHEFGAVDEFEYERMADEFVCGVMVPPTAQCFRPKGGHRVRFNVVSCHFGVACMLPEFVRTFYIPNVHWIGSHGGNAGFLAYECGRVDL
jgi:hypothetical protein